MLPSNSRVSCALSGRASSPSIIAPLRPGYQGRGRTTSAAGLGVGVHDQLDLVVLCDRPASLLGFCLRGVAAQRLLLVFAAMALRRTPSRSDQVKVGRAD